MSFLYSLAFWTRFLMRCLAGRGLAVSRVAPRRRHLLLLTGLLLGLVQPVGAQPTAPDSSAAVAVVPAAAGPLSLNARVEAAYLTLGRINASWRQVAQTDDIREQLPLVETNLQTIYEELTQLDGVISARQLLVLRTLLDDMRADLTTWRTELSSSGQQLTAMKTQLADLRQQLGSATEASGSPDGVDAATAADTILTQTLASIRRKLVRTSQRVQHQQQTLRALQNRVSSSYIHLLELDDNLSGQFRQLRVSGLRPDARPLLGATARPAADTTQRAQVGQLLQRLRADQWRLLGYYLAQHGVGWGWLLALGGLFFWWVRRNFQPARPALTLAADPAADQYNEPTALPNLPLPPDPTPAADPALDERALPQLRPWPVAGTLVVMLTLAPFFALRAPIDYLQLLQGLLLLTLTWHLARAWPRRLYGWWLALLALLLLLGLAQAGPLPGPGQRWGLVGLGLLAAAFGVGWGRRAARQPQLNWFVRPVLYLFAGLHLAAVGANLAGYFSLAKLLLNTANNALLQILALSTLIDLLTQALYLQMQRSRLSSGVSARFNFQAIERHVDTLLSVAAVVLWSMGVLTDINFYALVANTISYITTTPVTIGSASISLLNVLLFVFIIVLTGQVQKFVGYFFGDADDDQFNPALERKGSRLVVIRLVVFAVGAVLAALASGLPVDKIALVFGALSVGIGLGLQNIVNNLVSGVILIFERPFQIGDYIEVAGKTGRVKDIGVRASKLVTMAGSEIIVPNGDLLSGHFINWTLSNNHMRVALDLKLAASANLEQARQLISAEVLANPNTLPQAAPEILLRGITSQLYDLQVLFWINNIRQEQQLKSEILANIHRRFGEEGLLLS